MPSPLHDTALFCAGDGSTLSIVLQGGVGTGNIVQVASHCRHWRDLFPEAEIILSISALDIIGGTHADGHTSDLMLHPAQGQAALAHTALEVIRDTCDKVVQAQPALPLPPIKTDSPGLNNVNLQIAAAQAGLAVATGTHILRTRSDLIFANDSFIQQWLEGNQFPRGERSTFDQRVLISYLFTLNPYTYERYPFHYSDWFHFGLEQDVRALWNVPFMTMGDAIHYKLHGCADHSNHQERRMLTRIAVEQHVAYRAMAARFNDLRLDFHNDLESIRASIDILCDNFIICDLTGAQCVFEKYTQDFANPLKKLHCIPPGDWRLLVKTPPSQREAVLLERAHVADNPETAPFPRHYPAATLNTVIGEYAHGAIMAMGKAGILLHGPYDTLPRGSYTAAIKLQRYDGKGMLKLSVTLDQGQTLLATLEIALANQRDRMIEIDFDIDQDVGSLLEVLVETPGIALIAVNDLIIRRREGPHAADFCMLLFAGEHPLKSNVGRQAGRILHTTAAAGHLLYGPYTSLERGSYTLDIELADPRMPGRSYIEILGGSQHKQIMYRPLRKHDFIMGKLEIDFALPRKTENVEFRLGVDQVSDFGVSSVRIVQKTQHVKIGKVWGDLLKSRLRQATFMLLGAN